MLDALKIWRLYPTQIESGLSLFTRHDIGEWFRGELSSRKLLVLLEELPEKSRFKEARDRTYRLVKHEGELKAFTPYGTLPDGVELVADNVVDWTQAEHVWARIARESAVGNYGADADFTGLIPPLDKWSTDEQIAVDDDHFRAISNSIEAQLSGRAVN